MKKEIEEIKGMLNKLSDAIHIKTNGNGYNEEVMVRDITIKLNSLNIDSVVGQSEQLLCCCDNPNGFKEMEEGKETCSKCGKPY